MRKVCLWSIYSGRIIALKSKPLKVRPKTEPKVLKITHRGQPSRQWCCPLRRKAETLMCAEGKGLNSLFHNTIQNKTVRERSTPVS